MVPHLRGTSLVCSAAAGPKDHDPSLQLPRLSAASSGSRRSFQRPHARVGWPASLPREPREGDKAEPAPIPALARRAETAVFRLDVGYPWMRGWGRKWWCVGNGGRAESRETCGLRTWDGGEKERRQRGTAKGRNTLRETLQGSCVGDTFRFCTKNELTSVWRRGQQSGIRGQAFQGPLEGPAWRS